MASRDMPDLRLRGGSGGGASLLTVSLGGSGGGAADSTTHAMVGDFGGRGGGAGSVLVRLCTGVGNGNGLKGAAGADVAEVEKLAMRSRTDTLDVACVIWIAFSCASSSSFRAAVG